MRSTVVTLPLAHGASVRRYDPGAPEERLVDVARAALRRLRRLADRAAGRSARGSAAPPRQAARLQRVLGQRDAAREKLTRAVAARDEERRRADSLAAELEGLRAAGDVASGRDRTDLSYVVVVTYGRSGSTLLQGILSSVPGVMIRGENGGVVGHLFGFHDTARTHRDRLARPGGLPPSHPWWGIDGYPDDAALRNMRRLLLETVLRPAADTRVVGFKEIDWPTDRLPEVLQFLRDVLPGVRFVLNTRDLQDVARSKWWARDPDALTTLTTMEQALVDALAGLGDAAYRVHYDDYVADPRVLRGLFDWLGEDFDEERVRAVMDVRHSY